MLLIQTCSLHSGYSQITNKPPDKFQAKVAKVWDGDTFDVIYKDSTYRIRLFGIDAPEFGQDFYQESKLMLTGLARYKYVIIENKGEDRYGRTLGVIYRKKDFLNINYEMVKDGFAWNYTQYSHDTVLIKLENDAREKQLGLWSGFNYLEPWEFRKSH